MKKYFLCLILTILLSGCGMMFKNNPTSTRIKNNSKGDIQILDNDNNLIQKIKPDESFTVYKKKSISLVSENGSQCKVDRTVNGGIVAADILASLFVPFWPVTIPLIWISETAGGYLRDNISYVDTSMCFAN